MDSGEQQPVPLRIVKSTLDINNTGTMDGTDNMIYPKPSGVTEMEAPEYRKASAATDKSKGSIRGDPGASQRRLAIPKKRQPLPTWHDDGTGRFFSPSASYSATMIRRNQNATDNTGPGSGSDDLGFRSMQSMQNDQNNDGIRPMPAYNEPDVDSRYDSIGPQFAEDEQYYQPNTIDNGNRFQQHLPSQRHNGRQSLYIDNDMSEHLRRMSIRQEDPFYTGRDISCSPMQASPYANPPRRQQYWGSGVAPDFGRQVSMQATQPGLEKFDTYGPEPGLSRSYGRPISMDPVSAMPNTAHMFPREPLERAATTAPFESRHWHQPLMQHGQYASPIRLMQHPSDLADQRMPSRMSHFGEKIDTDMQGPDPRILVPMITVTPECKAVEGNVNSFWVAVELSANITQPLGSGPFDSHAFAPGYCQSSISNLSLDDDQELYRFGYISNLDIKILPSYQAEILEVIGKSSSLL